MVAFAGSDPPVAEWEYPDGRLRCSLAAVEKQELLKWARPQDIYRTNVFSKCHWK